MTDTKNDQQPEPETREGKRARHFKGVVGDLLEEVVEVMEEARKEGFAINFNITQNNEGQYILDPQNLSITKRW
jgi:hypothetical protein